MRHQTFVRFINAGAGQAVARRRVEPRPGGLPAFFGNPRNVVFLVLVGVLALLGGRKLWQAWKARKAVNRLGQPGVTPELVEAMAQHGRAGLMELFQILGTADDPRLRDAAGRALAALWAQDQLIAEEEKALVRRGFLVTWKARRRYPRALQVPIPIEVTYGVPFLRDGGPGVRPDQLEWSHRVRGAERASLEVFSDWRAGRDQVAFPINPSDFPGRGPHRLELHTKVRTRGLTEAWELELPHMAFAFEFDPLLQPESLLTLPDVSREAVIARAVRLEPVDTPADPPRFLAVSEELVIRDPPEIVVSTPLPCDLAHRIELEFEGVAGRFPAGAVLLSGQETDRGASPSPRRFSIGPIQGMPPPAIAGPGESRLRVILTADAERGWTDPDIRSIWPEPINTEWATVRVIRR